MIRIKLLPALILLLSLAISPLGADESEVENLELTVVFAPRHKALLAAEVATQVLKIHKEFGQSFTKGEELLVLDDRLYRSKVLKMRGLVQLAEANLESAQKLYDKRTNQKRAEAELSLAKASLAELEEIVKNRTRIKKAEAELSVANKNLQATEKLYKDNIASNLDYEGARKDVIIAQSNLTLSLAAQKTELEQARKSVLTAEAELELTVASLKPNLESAKKDVLVSKANLQDALQELESCRVRAPFDGRVRKVLVNAYEQVQKGRELLEVVDDSVLLAQFLVPSTLFQKLRQGQSVRVGVIERDGETVTATLSHISASIDPASESFMVYAEVPNQDRKLRSGMRGRVLLQELMETAQ